MRTEYVIPLQGMMASRVRQLDEDIAAAASTAHRKRLEKERAALVKQNRSFWSLTKNCGTMRTNASASTSTME